MWKCNKIIGNADVKPCMSLFVHTNLDKTKHIFTSKHARSRVFPIHEGGGMFLSFLDYQGRS